MNLTFSFDTIFCCWWVAFRRLLRRQRLELARRHSRRARLRRNGFPRPYAMGRRESRARYTVQEKHIYLDGNLRTLERSGARRQVHSFRRRSFKLHRSLGLYTHLRPQRTSLHSHHDGSDDYELKRLTHEGYELADRNYFAHDRQLHNTIMGCNFYSALPRYASKVYGLWKITATRYVIPKKDISASLKFTSLFGHIPKRCALKNLSPDIAYITTIERTINGDWKNRRGT